MLLIFLLQVLIYILLAYTLLFSNPSVSRQILLLRDCIVTRFRTLKFFVLCESLISFSSSGNDNLARFLQANFPIDTLFNFNLYYNSHNWRKVESSSIPDNFKLYMVSATLCPVFYVWIMPVNVRKTVLLS